MEVSPPREAGTVVGGGQTAEIDSPVGCFPRLFRTKGTKGKGRRKAGLGSSLGRWGRRRTPSSPPAKEELSNPPPADAAAPSDSPTTTAPLALSKASIVSTTSTTSTASTVSHASDLSSSPEAGAGGVNIVAFKSPVIISSPQPSLRAVAAVGGTGGGGASLLRGSSSHPQLQPQGSSTSSKLGSSRQGSLDPSQAPGVSMNRSMSTGSSLWGMGVSMTRGLSIEDLPLFGKSGSGSVGGGKLTRRSMSRR